MLEVVIFLTIVFPSDCLLWYEMAADPIVYRRRIDFRVTVFLYIIKVKKEQTLFNSSCQFEKITNEWNQFVSRGLWSLY
jgi:hypothetical protein